MSQDHPGQKEEEWPLYKLADYEAGGSLLDSCRNILFPHIRARQQSRLLEQRAKKRRYKELNITSGYQTQEDSQSPPENKLKLAEVELTCNSSSSTSASGAADSLELFWWQLIEETNAGDNLEHFRSRVLRLWKTLSELVGPFLVQADDRPRSKRLQNSRSLQPVWTTTTSGVSQLILGQESRRNNSIEEQQLSPASLRRLSWRRKVLERAVVRPAEPEYQAKTFSLVSADTDALHKSNRIITKWLLQDNSLSSKSTPNLVWCKREPNKRGRYGESLVHLLIAGQTNEHLILLVLLLELWPRLLTDVFESAKFKGLGCLHLSIGQTNERLLAYLLSLAKWRLPGNKVNLLLEQKATGLLFRSPLNLLAPELLPASARMHQKQPDSVGGFWCDRQEHWPSANGHLHLILSDRLLTLRNQPEASNIIYLGDSPLAWSVSFQVRSMFELLLAAGANANGIDLNNGAGTCLHLICLNNQTGWTRFLVKSGCNLSTKNKAQQTPLLLAAYLGRYRLFEELLELSACEFWSYSMIRCCGYPLSELDSIVKSNPEEVSNINKEDLSRRSALSVILESGASSNEQKSRLLSSPVVKRLLEEKWRIFGRRLFYNQLLTLVGHLLLLTLALVLRPISKNSSLNQLQPAYSWLKWQLWTSLARENSFRYLAEVAIVLLSSRQLIRFRRDWRRGYQSLSLQWTYNPLLYNSLVANSLLVLCLPVRLFGLLLGLFAPEATAGRLLLAHFEDVLLVFAAPLLWSSLLFFVAAFRVTGPFVAIIRHMIVRDLRQFSLIYLVFLYAFAQCIFFVNYKPEVAEQAQEGWSLLSLIQAYLALWMELFKMTLGVYDLQPFRHSSLARLFLLLFIYLIPILFNMLIAMMNNTYSLIISQSERAWSFQWARTLFALERGLGQAEKELHLGRYSISMPATGSGPPAPALMIIKRMDFTRAERRRLVLGYWLKSIRFVLEGIKRRRAATC